MSCIKKRKYCEHDLRANDLVKILARTFFSETLSFWHIFKQNFLFYFLFIFRFFAKIHFQAYAEIFFLSNPALKGPCHEIFDLCFSFIKQLP
jgi:hypothetical protein